MSTRNTTNKRIAAQVQFAPDLKKKKEDVPAEPFLDQSIRISLSGEKNILIADEFPDGTDDIPLTKKAEHNRQEWKKVEETHEIHKVYMYGLLEKGELWATHYSGRGKFIYKCFESTCKARLKVEVHEVKKEQEEEKGKNSKVFTSQMLKNSFDLQVPKLIISRSYQHGNHKANYQQNVIDRLKGTFFQL